MSPKLRPGLIIPDVHIPYNDPKAWQLLMKAARWLKPSWIVVLGDFGDFYAVSSFAKDPTRATQLDVEIKGCNDHLDQLDSLGATEKHFIAGNHCHRLERYLQDKAPELFNMIRVDQLFKLKERGWTYTKYRDDKKIGKVYFTHDTGSSTGRTAAYKAMDTYQHSIVIGHTHRMAYAVEGNAVGDALVSAQFGWLGDVSKVDYQHRIKAEKDYALGFGIGYLRDNGFIYFQPIPIVEYSCVLAGKLFTCV